MSDFYRDAGQVVCRHEQGRDIVCVRFGARVFDIGPKDESVEALAEMLSLSPWMKEALEACLEHPTTIRSKKLRAKLLRALGRKAG